MDIPTFFDLIGNATYDECLHALKCRDMQTVSDILAMQPYIPPQKSILHVAVLFRADKDVIIRLIEAGANVHKRDDEGRLPLHYAALGRSPGARGVVRALLEVGGTDVNDVDYKGYAPLHYACMHADASFVSFLIEAGACVKTKTYQHVEPIHFAARNERHGMDIVHTLVEAGANINVQDEERRTPLHYAVETGGTALVSAILARGALVNAVDWKGRAPHHYTCHMHIVQTLFEAGADLTLVDTDGKMGHHSFTTCIYNMCHILM